MDKYAIIATVLEKLVMAHLLFIIILVAAGFLLAWWLGVPEPEWFVAVAR